ncbi:MAG: hypothetical protein U5L09_08765 [Bacteroidales bacterium]|nr:hypothetical protein [Bacteroidales bacterium]
MGINIHKITLPLVMTLLAIVPVLDIFSPEEHPLRFYAINAQAVILGFSLLYFFHTYIGNSIKKTSLHTSLTLFMIMLLIYSILTPNLSILPVLLYSLSFFFLSYYLTYNGVLKTKHIQYLAFFLLLVYGYETYLSIFERAERLGIFYRKAANVGYKSLALMFLFALDLKKPRNIVLLSVSLLLVVLSFKRGAILSGAVAYVIAMWPVITGKFQLKRKTVNYFVALGIALIAVAVYLSIQYWDIIAYRFVIDETYAGSGRVLFWTDIVNGWINADSFNKFFGFGLFKVPEFLSTSLYGSEIYAHSDWFELLYDHGIFGILIYSTVIVSLIKLRKVVYKYSYSHYYTYLMILVIWISKSVYSGNYINKVTIYSTLVLGFILAIAYRNKQLMGKN